MTTQFKANIDTLFNSKQTSLKPIQHGKRQPRKVDMKLNLQLQLFKPGTQIFRVFATQANNGTVSFFLLNLMTLIDSYTNNQQAQVRPLFVSSSLDPKEYTTKDNRIVYSDSNTQVVKNLNAKGSNYNSAIVNGNIGTALIPFALKNPDNTSIQWDNAKHNAHAYDLAKALQEIEQLNTTDSAKEEAYNLAWNRYQSIENQLKESGVLIENSIIVAKDNGIIPMMSTHQYMDSPNQYFSGVKLYSTESSKATYCPMLNSVSGVVTFTNSQIYKNSDYAYGISGGDENNPYKRCSVEAKAFDFLNKESKEPIRVIVSDNVANSKVSRAEIFQQFIEDNAVADIKNAELKLGFTKLGGFTSQFSLEGNNIQYSTFKQNTNELLDIANDVSIDKDISLDDTDDFMNIGDVTSSILDESSSIPSDSVTAEYVDDDF